MSDRNGFTGRGWRVDHIQGFVWLKIDGYF